MTVSWWRASLWIGGHLAVVFAAIVLVPMAGPQSGVLALWLVAATVGLWVLAPRVKVKRADRPVPTLWPDGGQLESWSAQQLIAKHDVGQIYANEGSPATLGDAVLLAIEEELSRRGIALCQCGAPEPDGIHAKNCQEIS